MRRSFEAKLVKRVCFLRIVMSSCLGPDSFVLRAKSHVRLTGPSSAEGSIVLNESLGFGQSSSGIVLVSLWKQIRGRKWVWIWIRKNVW